MTREGWVYFIQWRGGGPVKIGFAEEIQKRLAALQVASPIPLRLVDQIRGTRETEGRVLALVEPWRLRGEWFRPSQGLRDAVVTWTGRKTALRDMTIGRGLKPTICTMCQGANTEDTRVVVGLVEKARKILDSWGERHAHYFLHIGYAAWDWRSDESAPEGNTHLSFARSIVNCPSWASPAVVYWPSALPSWTATVAESCTVSLWASCWQWADHEVGQSGSCSTGVGVWRDLP